MGKNGQKGGKRPEIGFWGQICLSWRPKKGGFSSFGGFSWIWGFSGLPRRLEGKIGGFQAKKGQKGPKWAKIGEKGPPGPQNGLGGPKRGFLGLALVEIPKSAILIDGSVGHFAVVFVHYFGPPGVPYLISPTVTNRTFVMGNMLKTGPFFVHFGAQNGLRWDMLKSPKPKKSP
jgi:hypothetical protein